MSATEQMRAMLDGLMGTARDGSDAKRQHLHFSDPRVCRAFLLDCCPHDIFISTKLELGECSKVHDPALRADYLVANKAEDLGYERSALERLQAFVGDADKRTDYLKRKLAETQEELTAEETNKLNRVHELTEKLGKKLAQIEKAEADGDQELKIKYIDEVDKIKKERAIAEAEYKEVSRPAASHQQQNLRVCDVCSAYLGINDNDARLADHFGGKLHLGFITVREKLDDLKKRCKENRLSRSTGNNDKHQSRYNSYNERYSYRDSPYHHGGSRDRERGCEKDRHDDRLRDDKYRDHERDRSRSNSRYYRDEAQTMSRYASRGIPASHRDIPPTRDNYRDHSSSSRIDPYSSRYREENQERRDSRERSDRYPQSRSSRGVFDRVGDSRAYDDREINYQRKVREWAKHEADKARKYEIRESKEKDRRLLEEQESKKLKEFLEDYKDDRDDIRFYSGSGLQRRLADRRKEMEQDEAARQKEKLELEVLSRSCAIAGSSPQQIEAANLSESNAFISHSSAAMSNGNDSDKTKCFTGDAKTIAAAPNDLTGTINLNASSAAAVAAVAKPAAAASSDNNQQSKAVTDDKRKLVSELIGRIPTDKNQLFAQKLDWSLLDENLMEKRIRPWVTKKIAEYMGEKEVELIDFVCTLLNDHKDGNALLKEVAIVLDEEAEKFVVHLWRLLIFELEAKKIGLRK